MLNLISGPKIMFFFSKNYFLREGGGKTPHHSTQPRKNLLRPIGLINWAAMLNVSGLILGNNKFFSLCQNYFFLPLFCFFVNSRLPLRSNYKKINSNYSEYSMFLPIVHLVDKFEGSIF